MRHWSVILILALLFWEPTTAQEAATVSGQYFDGQTREPLPFVSVTVTRATDGVAITGALTDQDGRFVVIGLARGAYTIRTSFPGYAPSESSILIGTLNDIYDIGDIPLGPADELIEEVVVTARQEILDANLDRRVFSLDDNFAQATGSVLDALRVLPGVTVDQEGKVLLRGSDRVAILIDGKQSALTGYGNQRGLDSISAANFERIEIINNPSARYDASGMAGIINIVYREDEKAGLSMDAGIVVGTGQLSKRRPDLPTKLGSYSSNPRFNPRFNLSHGGSEMDAQFRAEVLVQENLPNNEFTTRFYDDGRVIVSQVPENREQTQYILSGGIDKYIDDSRTFSVSSIIDFETHTDVAQIPYIDAETLELTRYWFWQEKEDTGRFNLTLNYERAFEEPGHELTWNLQYTRGWEDESYYLNEDSPVRVGTDATHLDAEEHTLPLQFDYVRPLRNGRLEAGGRFQKRWIPVTYTVNPGVDSVIYPGLGDWSEWGEDIYAGYANYIREQASYAIEAGVRVEQTNVHYDLPPENIYYETSDEYDYFEVYPNIRLTYHIDDLNSVALHFNNRVDRPGEPELRIFPKYDDPELLKVGNPYLRPQFTESFEIAYEHLWDRGSVITSLYHRIIEDPFTRVYAIDDSDPDYDIINKIYQNVGSGTNTGIELLASQDIGRYWKLTASMNVYDNVIDAAETRLLFPVPRPFSVPRTEDTTWDSKLTSLLELPTGLRVQASLIYYAAKNIAQGTQAARSSIDLGVTKPIWGSRGELVLAVSDLLNDFGIKQNIDGEGFDAIYENYYQTQIVSMGINYQF